MGASLSWETPGVTVISTRNHFTSRTAKCSSYNWPFPCLSTPQLPQPKPIGSRRLKAVQENSVFCDSCHLSTDQKTMLSLWDWVSSVHGGGGEDVGEELKTHLVTSELTYWPTRFMGTHIQNLYPLGSSENLVSSPGFWLKKKSPLFFSWSTGKLNRFTHQWYTVHRFTKSKWTWLKGGKGMANQGWSYFELQIWAFFWFIWFPKGTVSSHAAKECFREQKVKAWTLSHFTTVNC